MEVKLKDFVDDLFWLYGYIEVNTSCILKHDFFILALLSSRNLHVPRNDNQTNMENVMFWFIYYTYN